MFCHACGASIDVSAGRCPKCGQPLVAPQMPLPPPVPRMNVPVQTSKWISEGWALVQADLGMFAVLTLIVAVIGSVVPVVLTGPMAVGFHIAVLRKQRTGKLELEDCFKGFDYFVPSLVASLLISIFVTLGTLACIVPGLILHAMYLFTYLFILDKRLDFWPAMQASANLAKTDLVAFSMFALALIGLNLAGALLCGVGLLITLPISVAAVTAAYRDLVGFEPQIPAV